MNGFIEGDKLILRTFKKDDLHKLGQLMAGKEICDLIGEVYPMTEGELEDDYNHWQKTQNSIYFAVVDKKTNEIIGETALLRIFAPWRTADLSIIIWDRKYWGKGYGKEIAKLIMDYIFNDINVLKYSFFTFGYDIFFIENN
jgi:RimJ/RimL family protein N-acetyltransferase